MEVVKVGFFKGLAKVFMDGYNSNNQNKQKASLPIDLNVKSEFTSYGVTSKEIVTKHFYENDNLFYIKKNTISIRHDKKITQKQISEKMGFKSISFISKFENGNLRKITHEQLKQIAEGLEVDISELLRGYEKI